MCRNACKKLKFLIKYWRQNMKLNFKDISIKKRLLVCFILVGIIPFLIISSISYILSKSSIENTVYNQLTSIREMKKTQVKSYFDQINNQISVYSQDKTLIQAFKEFSKSYSEIPNEVNTNDFSNAQKSISNYYSGIYLSKLRDISRETTDINILIPQNDTSKYLQSLYISDNPNKLGQKHNQLKSNKGIQYDKVHEIYHPNIKNYLEKFSYYDIFLVNLDGDVIYTVFKEIDFATNLINGPYKDSGLGEAFKKARNERKTSLIDYSFYLPSYNAPASFISSPIIENDEIIGVLIFQMPIDEINKIMTFDNKWNTVGLGDSGESYLISDDYKMRSTSRLLIEDKQSYLETLKKIRTSSEEINKINSYNTPILIQEIKTVPVENTLKGQTGTEIVKDYRGISVLSSYSPLEILGHKWGIITEIDESEVFRVLINLKYLMILGGVVFVLIIVLIAYLIAIAISKPIDETTKLLKDISEGEGDLTKRLIVKSKDEIGMLSFHFNIFISKIEKIVSMVKQSATTVSTAADEISTGTHDLARRTQEQAAALEETSAAIEQLMTIVKQTAQNTGVANKTSIGTVNIVHEGNQVLKETVQAIENVSSSSNKILDIINVVNEIAFQTNLLALNAAIEAARAGEQGRGFAVVATEVRNLAQRSANAAKEIQRLITDSVEKIQTSNNSVLKTEKSLHEITDGITLVSRLIQEISTATQEQSSGIEKVNKAITQMDQVTQQNASLVEESAASGEAMSNEARKLYELTSRFKVNR